MQSAHVDVHAPLLLIATLCIVAGGFMFCPPSPHYGRQPPTPVHVGKEAKTQPGQPLSRPPRSAPDAPSSRGPDRRGSPASARCPISRRLDRCPPFRRPASARPCGLAHGESVSRWSAGGLRRAS